MNISDKKCFIFDLDGTVYLGSQPIQGTINFIKKNISDHDIYFITNNTSKSPKYYKQRLAEYGIEITLNQLITPFHLLFSYLRENHIGHVFLVANQDVESYFLNSNSDIKLTSRIDLCQAIVLTYDTEITFEKFKTLSLLLQNKSGIKYLATHSNINCPTIKGNVPNVGSFMELIKTSSGKVADMVFGKPNQQLLSDILGKYKKEEIVFIGDQINTDMAMAENAGIDFILVLSGETSMDDLKSLDKEPLLIVRDMGIFDL